jgi:phosphoribosylglycinamide formyltransferase-1
MSGKLGTRKHKPKLIIFASGTKEGGGSGFENLVRATQNFSNPITKIPELNADIIAVVSNHEQGGVRERARRLNIPFIHIPNRTLSDNVLCVEAYRKVVEESGAEWYALSGWLKHVKGLDPACTFNIHPALLSQLDGRFGGKGLHGVHVHEAIKAAFEKSEITETGVTMHFVTDEYDRGPIFFEYKIPLKKGMTAEEIGKTVNKAEHEWQPRITNMVIHGEIAWDGKDPRTLTVPPHLFF